MPSNIDIVTFFRKATLLVCGDLDLDIALERCLTFVQEHLPLDKIMISQLEDDAAVEHVVVEVSSEGSRLLELSLPLGDDPSASESDMALVDSSNAGPVMTQIGLLLGWGEFSLAAVPLLSGRNRIGTVYFVAQGGVRFQTFQARLLAQLGGSFSVALSNYLRHRDSIEKKITPRRDPAPEEPRLAAIPDRNAPVSGVADMIHHLRQVANLAAEALGRNEDPLPPRHGGSRQEHPPVCRSAIEMDPDDSLELDHVVARHIRRVLELAGGRVEGNGGAAARLGIHPSTLRKRMRKLGVPFGRATRA